MAIRPYLLQFIVLIFVISPMLASGSIGQPLASPTFEEFLASRFSRTDPKWQLDKFCAIATDVVAARVLPEYGAMFAAADTVQLPPSCMYRGETDVTEFRRKLATASVDVRGISITLQVKAAEALKRSIAEAESRGLAITPYDGAVAGSRSYGETLMLWNGRFFSGLDYWIRRGRLTEVDRTAVTGLDLQKRIATIINWESQGIYFSTDKTRSIFSSVAPPGASQHLSMLAFDVTEYYQPEIREILYRNGWYQTVVGDPLHFTFLGVPEVELQSRGLQLVDRGGNRYWVPNLSGSLMR